VIGIIIVICLAVFGIATLALVALNGGPRPAIKKRLDALVWEAAATQLDEKPADIRREEQVSGVDWLNRWMIRMNIAVRTRLLLYQADVKTPAETLLLISAAGWGAIAFIIYLRTGAVLASLLLSAGFVPVPLLYVFRRRAKRFAKFEQQLPEALDMLVSALKVGHSLVTGIGALGQDSTEPIAQEFRKLFDEQNFGLDLRTAMANLATSVPLQDVRLFVAAALIQKESGGNLAEVLEKVAQTTRERFRLKKQISVHTAQGRLTGWILSLLPLVLGLGMYLVNPEGMSVLWTRPSGQKLLCTALSMIVVGCLIIRNIVRIRV
jgi:tight adherence protein B